MNSPMPLTVSARLADFLGAGRTGKLILNIKDGRIISFELTESQSVDKRSVHVK